MRFCQVSAVANPSAIECRTSIALHSSLDCHRSSSDPACNPACRRLGALPLPLGERVGVRGFEAYRETLTPHPNPLPMGEGADRVRSPISVDVITTETNPPTAFRSAGW